MATSPLWLLAPVVPGFVPFLTTTFLVDTSLSILFMVAVWWMLRGIGIQKTPAEHEPSTERLLFFDALKGLAIAAVVIIHSIPGTHEILDFAVPLFVLVSGFLLFKRYEKSFNIPLYIAKFVWRIVPIYLLIVTISLIFLTNFPLTPLTVLFEAALGRMPWFHTSPSNYFIPLILMFYLLFIPAHRFRHLLLGPFGLLLALLLSIVAAQQFLILESHLESNSVDYALSLISPWRMLFFFLLGGALATHPIHQWPSAARSKMLALSSIAVLVCLALILYYKSFYIPFIYPVAVFLFCWSFFSLYSAKIPASLMNWLARIGKCSLLIYLLQWFVLYALSAAGIWSDAGQFNLVSDLVAFVLTLVVSLLVGERIQSAYAWISEWIAKRLRPKPKAVPAG